MNTCNKKAWIILFVLMLTNGFTQEVIIEEEIPPPESKLKRFTLEGGGGYSYRIAGISDDIEPALRDYVKGFKTGGNFYTNITFYIKPTYGIGFKYSRFISNNKKGGLYLYDPLSGTTIGPVTVVDNIRISYYGPYFESRKTTGDGRFTFVANGGLGYAEYKDEGEFMGIPGTITGNTLGLAAQAGVDIMINQYVAINVSFAYLQGTIQGDYPDEPGEDISRIDINAGLKFHF